MVSDLMI